jgi:hypothetical protein
VAAGRLTARIVLCAIKIFDLPYIFANFAPQFPYEPSEKPPSMAVSCDVHESLKHERPAFISGMSRLRAIAGLAVLAWGLLLGRNHFPARVPAGFNETVISGPWINAVGSAFESNGRMSYGV